MAKRLIQGIEDELTPLAEARMAKIKAMPCPRCHASMSPQLYAPKVFSEYDPLPKTVAYCQDCGATVEPTSGIVITTGDPRKVEDPLPIVGD